MSRNNPKINIYSHTRSQRITDTKEIYSKSNLMEKVKQGKSKIHVAIYTHFSPVAFIDKEKGLAGFDIDLINEIFTPLKHSDREAASEEIIQYIPYQTFDNIWNLSSDIHFAAGGIADTTERRKYSKDVRWTQPYFHVSRALLYRRDNHELKASLAFHKNDVINGLPHKAKIIATHGSTGWIDMENKISEYKRWDIQLIRGTQDEDDIDQLKARKVDAVMRGSFVCDAIAAMYKDELEASFHWSLTDRVEVGDKSIDFEVREQFCFPVSDSHLADYMDERIDELKKNGRVIELAKKWKLQSCD